MKTTRRDYWQAIEGYAKECIKVATDMLIADLGDLYNPDEGLDADDVMDHIADQDLISELVDGSSWIIYYDSARSVMDYTDNPDALLDIGAGFATGATFNEIAQQFAFCAMEQDVRDEINRVLA